MHRTRFGKRQKIPEILSVYSLIPLLDERSTARNRAALAGKIGSTKAIPWR
jgi:hypothetical protein